MHTTNSLLDALKQKLTSQTDSAIALRLGVSRQKISQYRRGDHAMGDDRALMIANELGLNKEEILLQIWAERAERSNNEPTFSSVTRILRRLGVEVA